MVRAEREASKSAEFPVVGIGASAGGITALQSLFKAISSKPNVAFVVVQHLAPDQPSQLAALLGNWTTLQVLEAGDCVKLECNCVFVAPPGQALVIEDGAFATKPLDRLAPRAGIDSVDTFFDSLAVNFGRRAIAVVLSGTGADGAAGAVRVKRAGGMVLVQDPITAMHEGMPRAAIANGAADHIMPIGAIAQELIACGSPDYVRASTATWAEDVQEALDGIINLIRTKAGFDFAGYKATPLLWRIQRRMELRRVSLFRDYEALLHDDPAELEALNREIPIHVTEFFRDAQIWERLRRDVLPRIFDEAGDAPIRVWTAACASGEEAYSVGMLLAEQAGAMEKAADFQVFATDAVAEIVARASRGIFKAAAVNALSSERRHRFFYAADGAFRVKRCLREKMVFAPQDLLADPPFSNLDLVTCRNLLIYLEPDAIQRVIHLLRSSLRIGGYLMLGKSESLSPKQRGFEELEPGARIYRKIALGLELDLEFPKRPLRLRTSRSSRGAVETHAHEAAVERHALPAVLVDKQFQIIRIYGDTGPFLRFNPGEPTLNLLGLLAPAMGRPLETLAEEVLARRCAVVVGNLADPATGELTLSIRLSPLDTPDEGGSRLLISFIRGKSASNGSAADFPLRGASRLGGAVDWGEALRLSHEELESSREELQALNEELRASNDQLNLANDDLATANARLRSKIEELETQSNVLSSGAVMTLFLDHELRVRWFTPAIRELFPLMPGDTGRYITDFVQKFDDRHFVADVCAVMQKNEPREAEVHSVEGKWFLRRIGPYLARTDIPAGVAVTFSDITARKGAEEQLQARNEELESFNKIAVGRELRMIELKKQINRLLNQRGEPARYALEFEAKDNNTYGKYE